MTMKKLSVVFALALMSTTLVAISSTQASAAPTLTTCTNMVTGKTLVLRSADAQCRTHLGSALWIQEKSDSPSRTGVGYATMTVCSSKNSFFSYKLIKDACPRFQVSTTYWRTVAAPATPVIEAASARGHDSASLFIKPTTSVMSAPVFYYLVTDIGSGEVRRVAPGNLGHLNFSGLSSESSYTFTIAAVNVDGTSAASLATTSIRTGAAPVFAPISTLSAPAFTISVSAETKTVNNAIVGYTINSSGGGTVASYSISPAAPAGLTFSTSDGTLSGTPTSAAPATAYTITATNASGSATRTFTLTVSPVVYTVGQTGPGGGKIFYSNASGFTCGVTYSSTCTYLEVALNFNDRRLNWSSPALQNTSTLNSTGTAIGTGQRNTALVVAAGATDSTTSAIAFTDQYVAPNGTSDWFLPSKDEMASLYDADAANRLGGFSLNPSDHWTSSQSTTAANMVWIDRTPGSLEWYKNYDAFLIPIRAG
jgi:hypothetical protein